MRRAVVVFVALVLGAGSVSAERWVPFEPGQPEQPAEFRVLSSNSFRTEVELELAGIYVGEIEAGGQTFQTIGLGIWAGGLLGEVGSPQVPVVARFLRIPDDRAVNVKVLELDEVRLADYRVYPLQPPQVESESPEPFVIDEKRYQTDELYPLASHTTSDPMIMRDLRLVQLVLQPVRHNPVTGELRAARRLRVELTHEGRSSVNVKVRKRPGVSRAFEPLYRQLVANYDFGPPQRPEDGSYLIITNDAFASAVESFAAWKLRKGWRTKVVTTNEIGGNDSAHVEAYVANAYNNWPYPPDYVLLVGDSPNYLRCCHQTSSGYAASDLPYSCKEGSDLLADLMIGRVSVENPTQAQAALNKLYRNESEPYTENAEWFGKACALGAYEGTGGRFWTVVIRIRNYVMGRPFTQFDTLFQRWGLNTAGRLTDSLNQGRSWMLYRGHGAKTGWANVSPSWSNSNVYALNNYRMTPIVIGPTCDAGDFDYTEECHAEAWLRAGSPDSARGGLGYFGSSEPSYSGHNDTLALGCYMSYVDSLMFTFGQCTQFGKLLMLLAYPLPNQTTEKEIWMFNNIGEPELNLWSATPASLVVNHPASVLIGSFPFEVTVNAAGGFAPVENALVCVMAKADTSVYHVGHTDASGRIQFLLNTSTVGDSILVTVTGRNLHPYLGGAMTISPSSAYVTYLKCLVNDSPPGGNGDGIINPGESVKLPIWVKNWGTVAASSVYGTLRTGDTNVSLTDSVKPFGTIAAGDSAYTGPAGYQFGVAAACTNGYVLGFGLECRDANDSVWNSNLNLWVGTPVLGYEAMVVIDTPPGGNGDGKLDPGETGHLVLVLRNSGLGHGHNVAGKLRSLDARFQVLDSLSGFGAIPKDTTGNNSADPFLVHADDTLGLEDTIPCNLLVTADGYSATVPFCVVVGEIRQVDPIPDGPREPALFWAYDDGDTNYTERPTFEWVEIRGIGTRLTLSDDQTVQVNLPAGFGPWRYYGQVNSQVSICGNGWVAPGYTSSSAFENVALPNSSVPMMVALDWDDLYPPAGGGVWHYYDSTHHRFVVEFDSVHYYAPRDRWDKYQLVIYDTTLRTPSRDNALVAQYLSGNNYTAVTVGLQDDSRAIGITCLCDGQYHRGTLPLEAGRAIKYTTVGPITGLAEGRVTPAGETRFRLALEPNPVRARTLVRLGLMRESDVRLLVFDLAGRQVRSIMESKLAPGAYSVHWDRTDGQGLKLGPGVYFLTLDTGTERLVMKAIVLD